MVTKIFFVIVLAIFIRIALIFLCSLIDLDVVIPLLMVKSSSSIYGKLQV